MASINRSRNTDFARVADDDPFAELTRIVGQGGLAEDRPLPANGPSGLDMENELLGNLARFERPERAPALPVHETADEMDPAAEDEVDLAMDAEFEAAFEDEWSDVEAAAPAAVESPEFEPELASPVLAWDSGSEPSADAHGGDDEHGIHLFDRVAAELHANGSVRTGIVGNDEARTLSDEEITAFAAGWEERNGAADRQAAVVQESEPRHSVEAPQPFAQDEEAIVPSAEQADSPEAAMEMPDLLLDTDLQMAFADGEDEAGALPEDEVPFDYDLAAADRHDYLERVLDDSLSGAFGEMEAAPQDEADTSAEADEAAAYIPLSEPNGVAQTAPVADAGFRPSVISNFSTVPFWGRVRREAPAPLREEHQDHAHTEHFSADALHAEPVVHAAEPAALEDTGRPQIDTIDIEDRVAAVVDDLDIPEPELPPEPIADSEFHELAAELAGAFGDMTDEALAKPETAAAEPHRPETVFAGQEQYRFEQPDAAAYAPALPEQEPYQFETAVAATAFDAPFEPMDREEFNAWAGGMDDEELAVAPAPKRRAPLFARVGRRGVFGAAALAGLVVVGGASVYALSGGGGGLGQPALVKASDDPFKVKPENPGGTTVSADNNEVYQRASGNVGDVPEQKALLTTAEEPLDLAKAVAPRIVDASAVRSAAAPSDDDWSKSQARLAPEDEAQEADLPAALTVQARRVETFIVRPDGTLVPREPAEDTTTEVASAAPGAQAESTGVVMDEGSDASAASVVPAADASAQPDATASADAASEPAEETAPVEPVAVASNAPSAEEPALAPAATEAASGWSVQISSQPTPEAAQESYRRMAERYGDLLAGRGVNIVKADIDGKGTYYRVRIPSASKDEAIELCTKLKGAGGNCFVSK